MSRVFFVTMFAAILFRWAKNWRRVVGVTLIATVSVGMVFPPPAYAQFGLLGGIQNILNIINGANSFGVEYDWSDLPVDRGAAPADRLASSAHQSSQKRDRVV